MQQEKIDAQDAAPELEAARQIMAQKAQQLAWSMPAAREVAWVVPLTHKLCADCNTLTLLDEMSSRYAYLCRQCGDRRRRIERRARS
mmetsp:Transcript_28571/g.91918  ORF Transcript_28571/g.91918 Transcript_28571/m.91918 type:complete len:87 (-) Transcript_28571:40-300(-)